MTSVNSFKANEVIHESWMIHIKLDSDSGVHATRFERSCSSRDTKEWLSIDVGVSNFTKEHFRESFDKNNWFDAIVSMLAVILYIF